MENIERKVAVAIIENNNKFFCCKRPKGKIFSGFWEFPGGKVEIGESFETAIHREIKEELDSYIEIIKPVALIKHNYDFGQVEIKAYLAKLISKEIKLMEHEEGVWVTIDEFDRLQFPKATELIIEKLKEAKEEKEEKVAK